MSTAGRSEPEGSASSAPGSGPDSLEQVREILFGAHQRDLTRRLGRTDARMAAQAEELRSEVRRRLDVLEAHTRKELEALTASMTAQEADGRDALGNATRASRESAGVLEQRIKKLEDLVERVQRELREQLLAQAKSFMDEVQRTRAELASTFERELAAWGAGESTERGEPSGEEAGRYDTREHREAA